MTLYIDTSDRETITVGLGDKRFKTEARQNASQKLLAFIEETLKREGVPINQITQIEVNTGPGSFTGLRVGVAVANTLGWALGIPVNGKNLKRGEIVDINYS